MGQWQNLRSWDLSRRELLNSRFRIVFFSDLKEFRLPSVVSKSPCLFYLVKRKRVGCSYFIRIAPAVITSKPIMTIPGAKIIPAGLGTP